MITLMRIRAFTPNRHWLCRYPARRAGRWGFSPPSLAVPLLPSERGQGLGVREFTGDGLALEKPFRNQPLLDSTPIPSFSVMGIPQTKREHGMATDDAWRGEMWDAIGRG